MNLSHVQLNDPKIKDQIMSTLARNGVEPQQLQLEVTESEIMRNPASTIALLQNLKSQGIRLAMDDFGTGHSSLSCLHEYPFDVVKIDRSFIKNFVGGSREFASLLHAMVGVVTNLNMACVGEGVETQDQLTLLQAMGCEFGQGRYFAMPVEQANLTCQYWRQGQCIVRRKSA